MEMMKSEAMKEAKKRLEEQRNRSNNKYAKYKDDPVGFLEDVLGETVTPGIRDMLLSIRDYPVTVVKSANAVGKTWAAARAALWFFKTRDFDEVQVYTTAAPPLENLKNLLWGEIFSVTENNKKLFGMYQKKGLSFRLSSVRSLITGVTIPSSGTEAQREAKFSGKHSKWLFFIIDEGDAVPHEVYKGIESCMSGGISRMLVMFNPRHASGPVYDMIESRRANVVHLSAFDHPNVLTGEDLIPGAVTREVTVRRINEFTRPLAEGENFDMECFNVPDYLVGCTALSHEGIVYEPLEAGPRKVVNETFFYMVMGEYPPQSASQLISSVWIKEAQERWKEHVDKYGERPAYSTIPVASLDVADMGGDLNVMTFRYGDFVPRQKFWTGMDLVSTADLAYNYAMEHKVESLFIDGTGVGTGIAPNVNRICKRYKNEKLHAFSIQVSSRPQLIVEEGKFKILRDQLYWTMREWFRAGGAMIPPDPILATELKAITYSVKDGFIRVLSKEELRKILRHSTDRADSLALTFSPSKRAKVRKIKAI